MCLLKQLRASGGNKDLNQTSPYCFLHDVNQLSDEELLKHGDTIGKRFLHQCASSRYIPRRHRKKKKTEHFVAKYDKSTQLYSVQAVIEIPNSTLKEVVELLSGEVDPCMGKRGFNVFLTRVFGPNLLDSVDVRCCSTKHDVPRNSECLSLDDDAALTTLERIDRSCMDECLTIKQIHFNQQRIFRKTQSEWLLLDYAKHLSSTSFLRVFKSIDNSTTYPIAADQPVNRHKFLLFGFHIEELVHRGVCRVTFLGLHFSLKARHDCQLYLERIAHSIETMPSIIFSRRLGQRLKSRNLKMPELASKCTSCFEPLDHRRTVCRICNYYYCLSCTSLQIAETSASSPPLELRVCRECTEQTMRGNDESSTELIEITPFINSGVHQPTWLFAISDHAMFRISESTTEGNTALRFSPTNLECKSSSLHVALRIKLHIVSHISLMGMVYERKRSSSSDYGYCVYCEEAHKHDALMQASSPWNPLRRPLWQSVIVTAVGTIVLFLVNQLTTLLVGFYPTYAKHELNASQSQISILFSIYPLCIMVACPMASSAAARIGRQSILCLGLFASAMSTVAFAYATNVTLLIFLRSIQGTGAGMAVVGSVAMIVDEFTGKESQAVGIAEITIALAFVSSPMFGSILFDWGGIELPFLISGVAQLACVMVLPSLFLEYGLPDGLAISNSMEKAKDSNQTSCYDTLSPTTLVCLSVTTLAMCGIGVIDPNLGSHLQKQLDAQHVAIGIGFGLSALLYFVGGYLYGWLSSKCGCKPVIVAGIWLTAMGFLALGLPSLVSTTSTPSEWALWSVQGIALTLIGGGTSLTLAPTLPMSLASINLKPTVGMQLLVGVFGSAVYLGQALGPFIALGLMEVLPKTRTTYCPDGQLCESPLPWVFTVYAIFLCVFGMGVGNEQETRQGWVCRRSESNGQYICGPPELM
ncbi:Major Facilitator Superfamily (MFS) [Thraustotheca clavata]|uniref:Major Facilitator Superfamily (MFS) n=1 Tax=Thraustotheca clavata TaxID=74557 RepID=A0A1V9Y8N9_9STRA|nr:Major Facilitator Superfamily (MFS) [Thraustotheca clavata]